MFGCAKRISTIAAGLLLAWQAAPALSQQRPPVSNQSQQTMQAPNYRGGLPAIGNNYESESITDPSFTYGDSPTETIKERYPNGAIKIERQVTQDAHGNYVNHGPWKMLDQKGDLIAQGEYLHGNRTGEWIRWYRSVTDAELLSKPPYQQYAGPFISQATFKNGALDGAWTIYDGKKHKISEFFFTDGRREGIASWWHTNGRKMREVNYHEGEMDGPLTEWNADGKVIAKDTFKAGRKLAQKSANYTGPNGGKKSEGTYLFAKELEQTPDDWWSCKVMTTTKTGKDEKHGHWTSWHSNGQIQLEGDYEHDVQVGKFSWWHANGQKALEGSYTEGKQDGPWTWWYATGQKSISGGYSSGNPTGRWTWWKEDGKVSQSADLSHTEGVVIDMPRALPSAPAPRASVPMPRQPIKR